MCLLLDCEGLEDKGSDILDKFMFTNQIRVRA